MAITRQITNCVMSRAQREEREGGRAWKNRITSEEVIVPLSSILTWWSRGFPRDRSFCLDLAAFRDSDWSLQKKKKRSDLDFFPSASFRRVRHGDHRVVWHRDRKKKSIKIPRRVFATILLGPFDTVYILVYGRVRSSKSSLCVRDTRTFETRIGLSHRRPHQATKQSFGLLIAAKQGARRCYRLTLILRNHWDHSAAAHDYELVFLGR